MEEKLIVYLDGEGKIQFETEGMHGAVCDKVADQILVGLKAKATDEKKKDSYWEDGADPVSILVNA